MPRFQPVDLFRFPGNLLNYVTAYHIPSFIRNAPFPSHALLTTFFRAAFGLTSCNRRGVKPSSYVKVAECKEGPLAPALWERLFAVWSSGPRTFHTNPITGPLEIWKWHWHLYDCSRPVILWMRYEPFMSSRHKTKSYENYFYIKVLARVRSIVLCENLVLNRAERVKLYLSPLTDRRR
jgi:hypothetical protein